MACGVVSRAIFTFLASALVLSSVPKVASNASSPLALIEDVCSSTVKDYGTLDPPCVQTLASEPRVAAAEDLETILVALLEVGISNATKTRSYIQNKLKQPGLKPGYPYVLRQCNSAYQDFVASFGRAMVQAKAREFNSAGYDIQAGYADNIDRCRNAMRTRNVKDVAISKGNGFVFVFGEVAYDTTARLPSDGLLI